MTPDAFQQAWRAQATETRVKVDAESLLSIVQVERQTLAAMFYFRDLREVLVALVLIPVWFVLGAVIPVPWTWYLTVPVLLWIIAFTLAYRWRHPHKPVEASDTLRESVEDSLAQIQEQTWMLRNVFWWNLLPFGVSILTFFLHVSWQGAVESGEWWSGLASATFLSVFLVVLYGFVYAMNQRVVDKELEPRSRELLELLASLSDEAPGGESDEFSVVMQRKPLACSPRRQLVGNLCILAILLFCVPAMLYFAYKCDQWVNPGRGERSPFSEVRWRDSEPEVRIGPRWFKFVSLDDIPTDEILDHSRESHGDQWRKRFEEDLVALLMGMGHVPGKTVQLELRDLETEKTLVFEEVPMTSKKRQAIWDAARERATAEAETPGAEATNRLDPAGAN